ncbi:MAG: ATP-binding cassette domain-containing protein [Oscillospiraceae bacterium]|nr:ATP-binding cassette domain-containing protein [Oscillospiraceae bacterium]
MEQYVIKIKGLRKQYRLGQIGGGTLRGDLQSWWARLRGKDDPNAVIGFDSRLVGQRFWALCGIDLQVNKGEALGIIGANGAGKSTLLKILSRITAPTEGSVDIYGRIASMLEVGTGFSPEMTGRENIYMNGAILGMTKAEIDAKMEQIIEFSECREFIDTPVKRYSSGMYVKLAFSVAAHLDAEIMIMDEVLAVGDMAFQKKCLDKMRAAAQQQGRTVLYVSHNMSTIRQLCRRCIVLDQGRIVFDGDTEEAIGRYLALGGVSGGTDRALSELPRLHESFGTVAKMLRLRLEGRENATALRGEKLRLALTWQAEKDMENVCLRLLVRTAADAVVGTAHSAVFGSCAAGCSREDIAVLDTAMLSAGTYYLSPALLQRGQGGSVVLDNVPRALTVEITDTDAEWNSGYMGAVRLPDMDVEQERKLRDRYE